MNEFGSPDENIYNFEFAKQLCVRYAQSENGECSGITQTTAGITSVNNKTASKYSLRKGILTPLGQSDIDLNSWKRSGGKYCQYEIPEPDTTELIEQCEAESDSITRRVRIIIYQII